MASGPHHLSPGVPGPEPLPLGIVWPVRRVDSLPAARAAEGVRGWHCGEQPSTAAGHSRSSWFYNHPSREQSRADSRPQRSTATGGHSHPVQLPCDVQPGTSGRGCQAQRTCSVLEAEMSRSRQAAYGLSSSWSRHSAHTYSMRNTLSCRSGNGYGPGGREQHSRMKLPGQDMGDQGEVLECGSGVQNRGWDRG